MENVLIVEQAEVLFSVQGHRQPFAEKVDRKITVAEFGIIAARVGAIEEVVEVFLDDADEPLEGNLVLIEQLSAEFAPSACGPPPHENCRHRRV